MAAHGSCLPLWAISGGISGPAARTQCRRRFVAGRATVAPFSAPAIDSAPLSKIVSSRVAGETLPLATQVEQCVCRRHGARQCGGAHPQPHALVRQRGRRWRGRASAVVVVTAAQDCRCGWAGATPTQAESTALSMNGRRLSSHQVHEAANRCGLHATPCRAATGAQLLILSSGRWHSRL
jgi:hypothetical protein